MDGAARRLSVNADDFGFTRDVNRGIIDAHRNGILTATTLMANGAAFGDAVALALANPSLDVGVHFVLVGGHSVRQPARALPRTVPELMGTLMRGGLDVMAELRAQVEKIAAAGIAPTHFDTPKHTHLLPPVLDAVARLAEESGVAWVRRPFDLPLHGAPARAPLMVRAASTAMAGVRRRFHSKLARHGCGTTDWFAGFRMTGRFGAAELVELIEQLPEGWTEFMTHPGYCTDELRQTRTRLKESRERELQALTDPRVREALARRGVALERYPRRATR
jgi:chitin disaccharide deacetylase